MRLIGKFSFEVGQVRTMEACPGRIAPLRHETGDHSVEDDSVVETLVGQSRDSLDVTWREVRPKPDDDVPAGRKGKGQPVVSHVALHVL